MLPYGVGVRPNTPRIRDVILHTQSGLLVVPLLGVIYGKRGAPVGAVCADGYVRLGTRWGGCLYAHRVVYEAANGEIPPGLEIDHLNGKKADNRLMNLEAVTKAQNVQRAVKSGLSPIGEAKPAAKLTEELVREIRRTTGAITNIEWARRLGVEKTTIRHARNGTTWKHVKCRGRRKPAQPSGYARPRRRPK